VPISRSGCLFVHIPKCAGTSVEVALGVADEYPAIGIKLTSTKPHLPTLFGGGLQHLTIREIRRNYPEAANRPGVFSFSIIRDPVDRLVSHFLWKHHRFADTMPDEAGMMKAFLTEVDHLVDLSPSLDAFRWPFDGFEYCQGDAQTFPCDHINRHLLPQCAYLFDRGAVPLDAIYPLSEIKALERDLRNRDVSVTSIPQRMVGKASHALRQMIPASACKAIQEVYRHDAHLHAQACQISQDNGRGYCPGTAVNIKTLAGHESPAARRADLAPFWARFPRKLWTYWHQGYENAPALVSRCMESWIARNRSWKINLLTAENLHETISLPDFYKEKLDLPYPALSDVIRMHLLTRDGGVWADSTTWCVRPLDEWLENVVAETGFFAYALPAPGRPFSSWFIAATPQHEIMKRLTKETNNLWAQVSEGKLSIDPRAKDYFWFHRLFDKLLRDVPSFADLWYRGSIIKADAAHYLQVAGLKKAATADVELHIRNKLSNVYKLDWHFAPPVPGDGTVLDALFKTL